MFQNVQNRTSFPFYTSLLQDEIAKKLMGAGITDEDGELTEKAKSNLETKDLIIDGNSNNPNHLEILKTIQIIFDDPFCPDGRCPAISLNVETSIKDIACNTNNYFLNRFKKSIKLYWTGSSIWPVLKNFMPEILAKITFPIAQKDTINKFITPNFQQLLSSRPNDYDFKFLSGNPDPTVNAEIANKGVVEPLVKKFICTKPDPRAIKKELAKSQEIAKNRSKTSYLAKKINHLTLSKLDQATLLALFFDINGFLKVSDYSDIEKGYSSSLRSIGSKKKAYDFLISGSTRKTITAINALKLRIYFDTKGKITKVKLGSYLGKSSVGQSVIDKITSNMTFEDNGVADISDFFRSLSHYTQDGHTIKEGWPRKIMKALKEEQLKCKEVPLSEILFHRLLSRVKGHHQDEQEFLVAMTFNLSAFLYSIDNEYLNEINLLWQLISDHLDKATKDYKYVRKDPIIKALLDVKQNSLITFKDIYMMFQIIAYLLANCNLRKNFQYNSFFTQIDKKVIYRIKLKDRPLNLKDDENPLDLCVLFFSYDLPNAIEYLNKIAKKNPVFLTVFNNFYTVMTQGDQITFHPDQSSYSKDSWDPRLSLSDCQSPLLEIMDCKNVHVWKIGYQLSLSVLAQKNEPLFFKEVLKKKIAMLGSNWASEDLKNQKDDSLYECKAQHLNEWNIGDVIYDLFSIKVEPFLSVAWVHFEKYEREKENPLVAALFIRILKYSLNELSISKNKESEFSKINEGVLIELIKYMARPNIFPLEKKLGWAIEIYLKHELHFSDDLKEALFESFIRILNEIKSPIKEINSKILKHIPKISLTLIRNRSISLHNDIKTISFARVLNHLNIFANEAPEFHNSYDSALSPIIEKAKKNNIGFFNHQKDFDLISFSLKENKKEHFSYFKQAIEKNLMILESAKFTVENVNALFFLMEWLVHSEHIWEERHLFIKTITTICKISPASENNCISVSLLENFHQSVIKAPYLDLLNFYLKVFAMHDGIFSHLFLKFQIEILSQQTEKDLKEFFILVTANLLKYNGGTHLQKVKVSLELYIQRLYDFGLNAQILDLYTVNPQLECSYSSKSISNLLEICSSYISKDNLDIQTKEKIVEIIKSIPESPFLVSKELETLQSLFHYFYDISNKNNDLFDCSYWLEKERLLSGSENQGFYLKALELIEKFAKKGHVHETELWILKIKPLKEFEASWIKLYPIIFNLGYLSPCLEILKKTATSNNDKFGIEWSVVLELMLDKVFELGNCSDNQIRIRQRSIIDLIKIIITDAPWINNRQRFKYIEIVSTYASLQNVEKILLQLVSPEKYNIKMTVTEKIVCWKLVLGRLSKEKSIVFLNVSDWGRLVWRDFQLQEKGKLISPFSMLLKGIVNALENPVFFEAPKESKKSKKIVKKQPKITVVDSARNAILFFESIESINPVAIKSTDFLKDPSTLLNFAKIILLSEVKKNDIDTLIDALTSLKIILTDIDYDPIIEQLAVQCFIKHSKQISKNNSIKVYSIAFSIIQYIQECTHLSEIENFTVLQFIYDVIQNIRVDILNGSVKVNSNSSKQNDPFSKMGPLLSLIKNSLLGIVENDWANKRNVPSSHKFLIDWALNILIDDAGFFAWAGVERCLKRNENLRLYLDDNEIEIVKYNQRKFEIGMLDKKLYVLSEYIFNKISSHNRLRYRETIIRNNGYGKNFRYYKNEDKSFDVTSQMCALFFIISSIALLGLIIFKLYEVYNPYEPTLPPALPPIVPIVPRAFQPIDPTQEFCEGVPCFEGLPYFTSIVED